MVNISNDLTRVLLGPDEECSPLPQGDLNGDCQIDAYEACLLTGNIQAICDCVRDGGTLGDCQNEDDNVIESCIGSNVGLSQLSDVQKEVIANFININGCSEENEDFIENAIDALIDTTNTLSFEEIIIALNYEHLVDNC